MRVHFQHCVAVALVCLGIVGCGTAPSETTVAGAPYDQLSLGLAGSKNQIVLMEPGQTTTYSMTFTNSGAERGTYRLATAVPASTRGWIVLAQPLPEEITLDPDAQFAIPVIITVPLTASIGMQDEFKIEAYIPPDTLHLEDTADVRVRVR